ncbi:MAG: hypothetical protein AAGI07_13710, partial [Bacteroidota bacterium]
LGIYYGNLHETPRFLAFEEKIDNQNLALKTDKQVGKKETSHFLGIDKVYIVGQKLVAIVETYDIAQENAKKAYSKLIKDPNYNFIKMWPVNNMNYHDYNIHIFSRRLEDIAVYQFKEAFALTIEDDRLGLDNLEIEDNANEKSFGKLVSMENEGIITVMNRSNGEVRKYDPNATTHIHHTKRMIDRDGNHVNANTAGAFLWKNHQFLHYDIKDNSAAGNYLLTLMKVKE